ncbi:hypothetical protein ACWCSH_49615, partial [Streptosporangium sp. NPDC001682]
VRFPVAAGRPAATTGNGSADDAEPDARRVRHLGQFDAFELDVGPARVVEQPDAVAQHDGHDEHEDLVEHTRL